MALHFHARTTRVEVSYVAPLGACALSLLLLGCGKHDPRVAVGGPVTFRDQPLKKGSIQFEPVDGGSTMSGAVVIDGHYSIPQEQGLAPGKYRVRVYAALDAAPDDAPPEKSSPSKLAPDMIPQKYNDKSSLTVEVSGDGPNVIPIHLK